ncbi:MAG: carbohydrate ABC transporter permease [Thermoprotei archaeon]
MKPPEEWTPTPTNPRIIPTRITLDNYVFLFAPFGVMETFAQFRETIHMPLANSLILSGSATVLALIIGTCAAYAMSRYKAGGEFAPFQLLMFRMFPPIAIIVPIMILYSALKWLDTAHGMIVFYTVVNMPFVIWLMKSFFDDIPKDIDEAAMLDGCSPPQVFFKVILPLVKPGIAVTFLFIFIMCWSDFLGALVLTYRYWFTLPIALSKYQGLFGYLYGPMAATGVIAAVPCMVIGIIIQKYLVRGFTFGAVKR